MRTWSFSGRHLFNLVYDEGLESEREVQYVISYHRSGLQSQRPLSNGEIAPPIFEDEIQILKVEMVTESDDVELSDFDTKEFLRNYQEMVENQIRKEDLRTSKDERLVSFV